MSTGIGYFFGLPAGAGWLSLFSRLDLWRLLHTLVGVALIASGTATLNQWYERMDALMRRTAGRPIPSGRVNARGALIFGTVVSIAGFLELTFAVNALSGVLGMLTLRHILMLLDRRWF